MENKYANTDYQTFVRVRLPKVRNYTTVILYRESSSPTWKKSLPPKVSIPIQNPPYVNYMGSIL